MEEMYQGNTEISDKKMLKKLLTDFSNKDIVSDVVSTIECYLSAVPELNDKKKFENLSKIFTDSLVGMLVATIKIEEAVRNKELSRNEENREIKILLEYYIFMYRRLFENISLIFDKAIYFDEKKYKKDKNLKKIEDYQKIEIKLNYIEELINRSEIGNINVGIFDVLRPLRNKLIHGSATSLIFINGNEPLFQLYTLEVDDLLDPRAYYSSKNCISCKYFIVTRTAYMVNFIKMIFKILRETNSIPNSQIDYCKIKHKTVSGQTEYEKIFNLFSKQREVMGINDDQINFFEIVKEYV